MVRNFFSVITGDACGKIGMQTKGHTRQFGCAVTEPISRKEYGMAAPNGNVLKRPQTAIRDSQVVIAGDEKHCPWSRISLKTGLVFENMKT